MECECASDIKTEDLNFYQKWQLHWKIKQSQFVMDKKKYCKQSKENTVSTGKLSLSYQSG